MQTELIQLPPLPADIDSETVQMIWLFAKLEKNEQVMIYERLKNMLEGSHPEQAAEEFASLLKNDASAQSSLELTEFAELMKRLIAKLIAQACEMAGLTYQLHCVENKSLAEMAREMNMDEESLRMIIQYYDQKNTTATVFDRLIPDLTH